MQCSRQQVSNSSSPLSCHSRISSSKGQAQCPLFRLQTHLATRALLDKASNFRGISRPFRTPTHSRPICRRLARHSPHHRPCNLCPRMTAWAWQRMADKATGVMADFDPLEGVVSVAGAVPVAQDQTVHPCKAASHRESLLSSKRNEECKVAVVAMWRPYTHTTSPQIRACRSLLEGIIIILMMS